MGAILFEIVTGKRPHAGKDVWDCLENAASNVIEPTERPESPRGGTAAPRSAEDGEKPSGADELIRIALHAMATEPGERYASVTGLQEAIREYRRHAQSLALTATAHEHLAAAEASGDYADYARAVFAFEAGRDLWADNAGAVRGALRARFAYAECARTHGDLDLAASLLDPEDPDHQRLHAQVVKARAERQSRQKRMRLLRLAAVGLMALVIAVLSVASIWIRGEQARTARERDRAVEAEKSALTAKDEEARQRAVADEARAEEARQRKVAEQALRALGDVGPTFCARAETLLAKKRFAAAYTNISYALVIEPEAERFRDVRENIFKQIASYARDMVRVHREREALAAIDTGLAIRPTSAELLAARGDVLQCLFDIDAAASAYRCALTQDPNNEHAVRNLALCEDLLEDGAGDATIKPGHVAALQAAMLEEGRHSGVFALAKFPGHSQETEKASISAALDAGRRQGLHVRGLARRWPVAQPCQYRHGGPAVARGMPVSVIRLAGNRALHDCSVLRTMPLLTCIGLMNTAVTDLSPLAGPTVGRGVAERHGMHRHRAPGDHASDLVSEPLRHAQTVGSLAVEGLELESLSIARTAVADISPLEGMPLKHLSMWGTKIETSQR